MGPPAELEGAFLHFGGALAEMGLAVREAKCAAWAPSGWLATAPLLPGLRPVAEGFVALGVPFGDSAYVLERTSATLTSMRRLSELLLA